MNDFFLQANHIVKRYAAHTALNDVSISVPRGKVFGLLGPNGAGKTTIIRIINRITAPDSGEVLFDGHTFSADDVMRPLQKDESRRASYLSGPAQRLT